jgi:hypothetical protein
MQYFIKITLLESMDFTSNIGVNEKTNKRTAERYLYSKPLIYTGPKLKPTKIKRDNNTVE